MNREQRKALRARVERDRAAKVMQPPQVKPPQTEEQRKGKPPPVWVGFIKIKASCGHEIDFGLMAENKDKFRAERRKKHESKPCTTCREARQHKEQDELNARKLNSRKTNAMKYIPAWQRNCGRLPDGSTFGPLVYVAATESWSGTLRVPTATGELTFEGQHTAVMRLLQLLDDKYREHLAREQAMDALVAEAQERGEYKPKEDAK